MKIIAFNNNNNNQQIDRIYLVTKIVLHTYDHLCIFENLFYFNLF